MKHLNASFGDLHRIFKYSITAREIAEPLIAFEGDRSAAQVRTLIEPRGFDVVGVRVDGELHGYAMVESLGDGVLRDFLISFSDHLLLDEADPILNALEILRTSSWVFIRFLNHPVGIITRSDLQKAPVRMWLFGIISLLEMRLLQQIRETYPDAGWKSYLGGKRIDAAQEIHASRAKKNEEIDLAECLQLCDKKVIFSKSATLKQCHSFESNGKWEKFMKKVETLRNSLAHSNSIAFGSWPEVTALVEDMERCINALDGTER